MSSMVADSRGTLLQPCRPLATYVARCRGIRRIQFRSNMSACEQALAANSAHLCMAHFHTQNLNLTVIHSSSVQAFAYSWTCN